MLPPRGGADARGGPGSGAGTPTNAQGNSGPPARPAVLPVAGDRIVWTTTDGARIYIIVRRVFPSRGYVALRCHYNGRVWIRKHRLPLFPSMRYQQWTTTDLQETLP